MMSFREYGGMDTLPLLRRLAAMCYSEETLMIWLMVCGNMSKKAREEDPS